MFERVRFQGNVWYVVFETRGCVHLTSMDGTQFKRHVDKSEIQYLSDDDDPHTEE